jgi:hypothetical protein
LFLVFRTAVTGAGFNFKAADPGDFITDPESADAIAVKTVLYFPKWKYKSNSTKKSRALDILVSAQDSYDCKKSHIVASTARIAYLDPVSDKEALTLLSLHYDFENPPKPAHPVFHAQLGELKLEDEIKSLRIEHEIRPPTVDLYGNARIPTPHMSICSVLIALAADHLPNDKFEDFLKKVKTCYVVKLESKCNALRKSLGSCGNLHSHHWY